MRSFEVSRPEGRTNSLCSFEEDLAKNIVRSESTDRSGGDQRLRNLSVGVDQPGAAVEERMVAVLVRSARFGRNGGGVKFAVHREADIKT